MPRTAKIATIEATDAARLGKVSPALFKLVAKRLGQVLGTGSVAN